MKILENIFSHPSFFLRFTSFLEWGFKLKKKLIQDFTSKNSDKLIDMGCGAGHLSEYVQCKYTGIDIDKNYIAYAKKSYGGKKFLCKDATNTKFRDKSFDIAMTVDLFHHLSDEDLKKCLKEISRTTKEKVLIIDTIKQPSFLGKILTFFDRGNFIRSYAEEIGVVKKFIKIKKEGIFKSGLYSELFVIGKIR